MKSRLRMLHLFMGAWLLGLLFLLSTCVHAVPGMGAVLHDGGVTFRVWAGDNIDAVSVAGTFNNWATTAHPLSREQKGYWAGDVASAKAGDRYKFVLTTKSGEQLWRNDPYARSLVWEDNTRNSVVVDTDYHWAAFSVPSPNELVIYEMSVKTFGGYQGVVDKLDYLKDRLAVNAIEIMPVHQTTTPGGGWGV